MTKRERWDQLRGRHFLTEKPGRTIIIYRAVIVSVLYYSSDSLPHMRYDGFTSTGLRPTTVVGEVPRAQVVRETSSLVITEDCLPYDPDASCFHDVVKPRLTACRGSLDKRTLQSPRGNPQGAQSPQVLILSPHSYLMATPGRPTVRVLDLSRTQRVPSHAFIHHLLI